MLLDSADNAIAIAECFIKKHKRFLKLYTIYCQNYKQTHESSERLEREHHLDKCIQRVRLKYGHALKMGTYLQLPVLRITKYHLLLSRYLKLISVDDDEDKESYRQMSNALYLMQQVNDQINREMPDLDMDENENDQEEIGEYLSLNQMKTKKKFPLEDASDANITILIAQYGDVLRQVSCIFIREFL